MHSRLVKLLLATLIASAMCSATYGATAPKAAPKPAAKPAPKAAAVAPKPAPKPAEPAKADGKFDQKTVLMQMWSAPDTTVVGSVNGVNVTKGELMKTLWLWNAPNQLQDLLTQKMIEAAAKKAGVSMTQQEIDEKVKESLTRSGMNSVDDLLNQYRVTYYRFMDANKINGLAEKTVQKGLQVSDAELAGLIKARHILVRPPADEKDKAKAEEAAKAKIDEIHAKIKAGGDFVALANEYTEDPSNNDGPEKKGGDLGWISKGRMVQEFESAAFNLKAGEVSEPVKTFYGYHIIKVDMVGKDAPEAEKAELKKMILEQKLQAETAKWYSETVEASKLDNKLMAPVVKEPTPVAPKPAPKPAPTAPKTQDPASSEKPDTPPPPPPPAQ